MDAVCPDVSQNLASLDTCHVMFLDVATTMLRKFMYFLFFVFPQPFLCKCALALPVKGPINQSINQSINRITHAGRPWSSRTTKVESNMKSEHNLYLACEDSPQRTFFFCTFSCSRLALLPSTVP